MAVYNLIGRRRRHDVTVPLLADKLRVNVFLLNFSAYIRFFVNILIEMNVDISNKLNFSDVYMTKFIWPNIVYTSLILREMKFSP